jgi:rod shape-determining protein MreC
MVADCRYHRLEGVRNALSYVVAPVFWMIDKPLNLVSQCFQYVITHKQLVKDKQRLEREQFLQNARHQRMASLEAENDQLRALLKSSPRAGETHLVAEIIRVDSDPFIQRIILDKGKEQEVTVGQPVIDAHGIVGEVIEVYPATCRVILLTDTSHGIPVENVRTGERSIALGMGAARTLEIQHLPTTVEVVLGDVFVTSGLDGKFPAGYPVGVVKKIDRESGDAFARISLEPSAHLEKVRQVLLLKRSVGESS